MPTRYVAHRGGAAQWPENSLTAFRNAIALGARVLELDVHQTADGAIAVIHDPTLDRTTSGHGPVARVTAADLAAPAPARKGRRAERRPRPDARRGAGAGRAGRRGDAGGDQDARPGRPLRASGRAGGGRARAALRRAGAQGAGRAARRRDDRARVRDGVQPGHTRRGACAGSRAGDHAARRSTARGGLGRAAGRYRCVGGRGARELPRACTTRCATPSVVEAAHRAKIAVGVFTVNDEATMRRLAGFGVDVIISDRADLVTRLQAEG